MISINVFSDERAWSKRLKKKELFFKKICKLFPKKYQFSNKKVSLTLLLSNNKKIKKLNQTFRNKNKSTDILSFPLNYKIKRRQYLGDIIISYEFMNRPKLENNILFKKKVVKLFIHGFLHLNGYDHKKNVDFNKMQNKEIEISNTVEKKLEKINSK